MKLYVVVIIPKPVLCARMVLGGVVEITIQHKAKSSAVLFIETTPPSTIRVRTARAFVL